jgi:hypothetical protein
MNTNALKKFAQETRRKLMQQVAAKLEFVTTNDTPELREKAEQVKKLKEALQKHGKEQLIDKVAYTWFNRFMALRFMDANDYQPLGVRILSPLTGQTTPEILNQAKQGDIPSDLKVNQQKVMDLLDGRTPSSNPQNEAYKELLIASCNHLHTVLPFLFERINDYTELLLPDDLTSEFSILTDVVKGMTEEDCHEVEIIGWLYQFYISEKKDEVFASKSKVKKEDIPAATQLFTPRWIVEYMVQNTLGKLWLQNKPNSKLREHMPYLIESPSLEAEDYLKVSSPEEIKLLDQACGSGHILVYGFDLLTKIYEEEGYSQNEIAQLILTKNLFGFEIDERAAQLAGMALLMKARSYQRRLFKKEDVPAPTILCYQDLQLSAEEFKETLQKAGIKPSEELLHDLHNMQQSTNLGSLILPHATVSEITRTLEKVEQTNPGSDAFYQYQLNQLKDSLKQLQLLAEKYHCVVDNPPYMGGGNMNGVLSDFVKVNYQDSKADLMTCFMEAGWNILLPNGILGMINLPSWLFLSSFERLREKLIKEKHIDSLLHMGRGIFGVDWGSTAFIIQNQYIEKDSRYFKLHKRNFQHLFPEDIRDIFLMAKGDPSTKINFDKYREGEGTSLVSDLVEEKGLQISYVANQKDFNKIPGFPVGYWLTKNFIENFSKSIHASQIFKIEEGLKTGLNERFIKLWFELSEINEIKNSKFNWVSHTKGGDYRKWFGNELYKLNYSKELLNFKGSSIPKIQLNQEYVTWGRISAGNISFRYTYRNFIPNMAGLSAYSKENSKNDLLFMCSLGNSKVGQYVLNLLNPTLNYPPGVISKIPINGSNNVQLNIVENCIEISKMEWFLKELSEGFKKNELLNHQAITIEESFDLYQQYWRKKFFQLHKNEEQLNRQFIDIYGLQKELTPDVPFEEITILKEETSIENGQLVFHANEVFTQFVSYAVGCMFGRYSLEKEGLVLANQGETLEDYLTKIEKSRNQVAFLPDEDNIIPVLDDDWFEDDIVGRFYVFLKASFGEANFQKNLAFVEECLGKDMRKFFNKDFYDDHIKRYKKRPIYWMFSSPKGSFSVLVYMHRYTPDTLNNILNKYLREFIDKLKIRKEHLEQIKISGSAAEQSKAIKEIDKLDKMLLDCQEYEREILYNLATARIAIDLDDGVLVNYNKFGKAIKEVKGLNDAATKKKVKEFDWIDASQIR